MTAAAYLTQQIGGEPLSDSGGIRLSGLVRAIVWASSQTWWNETAEPFACRTWSQEISLCAGRLDSPTGRGEAANDILFLIAKAAGWDGA